MVHHSVVEQVRLGNNLDLLNGEELLIAIELLEELNKRFNLGSFSLQTSLDKGNVCVECENNVLEHGVFIYPWSFYS